MNYLSIFPLCSDENGLQTFKIAKSCHRSEFFTLSRTSKLIFTKLRYIENVKYHGGYIIDGSKNAL